MIAVLKQSLAGCAAMPGSHEVTPVLLAATRVRSGSYATGSLGPSKNCGSHGNALMARSSSGAQVAEVLGVGCVQADVQQGAGGLTVR
jgi:hypothetical protein